MAINESNGVGAVVFVVFSQGLCRHRKFRGRLALHWRSNNRGGNSQGKVVGDGNPPNRRRNRAAVARARCGESGSVFRARARGRARATGKVLGAARGDEDGAALGRPGQANAARGVLAPVYGWFTEGFDTLDLNEAKVLLDALAL
jgi:hypothetical protein